MGSSIKNDPDLKGLVSRSFKYVRPDSLFILHESYFSPDGKVIAFCIDKDVAREEARTFWDNYYEFEKQQKLRTDQSFSEPELNMVKLRELVQELHTYDEDFPDKKDKVYDEYMLLNRLHRHHHISNKWFPLVLQGPPGLYDKEPCFTTVASINGISLQDLYLAAKNNQTPIPEFFSLKIAYQLFKALQSMRIRKVRHTKINKNCIRLEYPGFEEDPSTPRLILADFSNAYKDSTIRDTRDDDVEAAFKELKEAIDAGWTVDVHDNPQDRSHLTMSAEDYLTFLNDNSKHTKEWTTLQEALIHASEGRSFTEFEYKMETLRTLYISTEKDWRSKDNKEVWKPVWGEMNDRMKKLLRKADIERGRAVRKVRIDINGPTDMDNKLKDSSLQDLILRRLRPDKD